MVEGPIVGFRYWFWPSLLVPRAKLWSLFGDGGLVTSQMLWGTVGLAPWPSVQLKAVHAWNPARHVDPMERCICGIHGFTRWRTREQLNWFDQWPTSAFNHEIGLVGGAIIAWGRIAEHGSTRKSEGFRAEHARILALGDPSAAKLYRVPYVPEPSLELYASEFGIRLDELHQ